MIKGVFEKTKITNWSGKTYIIMGNNHIENDKGPIMPGLYLLSAVDIFNYLSMEKYSNLKFFCLFLWNLLQ